MIVNEHETLGKIWKICKYSSRSWNFWNISKNVPAEFLQMSLDDKISWNRL